MSTKHPFKSPLREIIRCGYEAWRNRAGQLFMIAGIFFVLPQTLTLLGWARASSGFQKTLEGLSSHSLLDQFILSSNFVAGLISGPTLLSLVCVPLGLLAMAQTSSDYFESSPKSLKEILIRSLSVLGRKGLGVFLALALMFPLLGAAPYFRSIAITLLTMLPIQLVVSKKGGFKSTWSTLFLRYALDIGVLRSTMFFTVIAVSGFLISITMIVILLFSALTHLDLYTNFSGSFFEKTATFAGVTFNMMQFISDFLILICQGFTMTILIPMTAAILYIPGRRSVENYV